MWKRTIRMVVAAGAAAMALAGCFAEEGPSSRGLPPTDELSTETSVSTPTTTASTTVDRSPGGLDMAAVISTASRVNNSDYHEAASPKGGPVEDTSQFHFSTPDAAVNCSTVDRDVPTLACNRSPGSEGPKPTATPEYCNFEAGYIVLTDNATEGACADTPWVLTKSTVLPLGSTISIRNFQCLSDSTGLYCLNTRSDNGFALRDGAYRSISGSDPAPASLIDGVKPVGSTSGG